MQNAEKPLVDGAVSSTLTELEPTLEKATARLRTALSAACSADVTRANTGELIRVEEVLAIANEAAKEVISVRRRLRGERRRVSVPDLTTEPGTSRTFTDAEGKTWQVFSVHPSTRVGRAAVRAAFAHGWLTFECGEETRRLAPIPEDWQTADDAALGALCEHAELAPYRRRQSDVVEKKPDE